MPLVELQNPAVTHRFAYTNSKLTLNKELMTVDFNNPQEMQTKYTELVKYVLTLEQETQKLENDRDTYRDQVKKKGVDGGFSFIYLLLAVIIAVALSKVVAISSKNKQYGLCASTSCFKFAKFCEISVRYIYSIRSTTTDCRTAR